MAQDLTLEAVGQLLASGGDQLKRNAFSVLRTLSHLVSGKEEDPAATDLVLRAMEHRDSFGTAASVLDGLLRHQGLFPYLEGAANLSVRDALAIEFHRPAHLDDVVFHRIQARIYNELTSKRSVVLSAPTSFGKSLLIDAVIASGVYRNVVIIVPTLALIDETRRRLTGRLTNQWKLITHHSQRPQQRNVYVLTAERVAEFETLPEFDFFIIDEFYKLSPDRHDDRCIALNQALYKLLKQHTPCVIALGGPSA